MKEVQLKRVVGPFERIPFENYIQLPIGLVPKAGNTGKTRLIFHLSYDFKKGKLLNHHTPRHKCSVKYCDLNYAVKAYLTLRENATRKGTNPKRSDKNVNGVGEADTEEVVTVIFGGKTGVQSAFRLVPLKKASWMWLVMKAQHLETGIWMYFVDKCLPFGASISCAIFQ